MNKVWLSGAIAGAMILAGASAAGAQQAPIEGVWVTEQESEMTISSCIEGFCGYISKIVITDEIRAKYGSEVDAISNYTDYNNPDEGLRDRPIQGLQILTLLEVSANRVYEGEIYNPEDGNTYSGELTVVDENTIKLKGCAFFVMCQEQIWRRQ